MFAIKVEAPNDTNGNGRRGWLVYSEPGVCIDWVEDGGMGNFALTSVHGDIIVTCVLAIPTSQWRRLREAAAYREATGR